MLSIVLIQPMMGLACRLLKLLLNPPGLTPYQSTLEVVYSLPFPGKTPDDRLAFAKQWYDPSQPREYPYEGERVQSRFAYDPTKHRWL
jgi:hypothetical protein